MLVVIIHLLCQFLQLLIDTRTFLTPRRVKENENVFCSIVYYIVKGSADNNLYMHIHTQQLMALSTFIQCSAQVSKETVEYRWS